MRYHRTRLGATHHVFLVPGFFGFTSLGTFEYWGHVRAHLIELAAARGLDVKVTVVGSHPTSSLLARAERLARMIRDDAEDGACIHVIGHSSGGLDARLMVAPAVDLGVDVEDVATRIRSVITIATPHRGTPLASFFRNLSGPRLLGAAARLMGRGLGKKDAGPEDLPPDARSQLSNFLAEVGRDQTLVAQLAPETMELFNATARDRQGVRYACVTAQIPASRMGVRGPTKAKRATSEASDASEDGSEGYARARPVMAAASRAVFAVMHQLSARQGGTDGVVPLESQVWGELLFEASADHLDVLGHFDGGPTHLDWFSSGSEFSRAEFETLWARVFSVIEQCRVERPPRFARWRVAAIAAGAMLLGSLALWAAR